jgi:hypothetical protein
MSRFILICSFAATLAASATQSADAAESAEKSAWVQESLACADLGIDPGSPISRRPLTTFRPQYPKEIEMASLFRQPA